MHYPKFSFLFSLIIFLLYGSHSTSAVKFNFKNFDGTDLFFLGDSELGSGSLSLTRKAPFSHGRGLYINQIPMKQANASAVLPFTTTFTFSITPNTTKPIPGHGLAFVVVPTADNDAAGPAGFLGFLNQTNNGNPNNHALAVEFDVVQDTRFKDINDNHVGVDVNSVVSTVSQKAGYWVRSKIGKRTVWSFKEVRLSSGDKYKVWIEYEKSRFSVTVAPENVHEKPKRPLIETNIDLSGVLLQKMYVGFSGAMGRGVQRHEIWNWTFKNSAKKN